MKAFLPLLLLLCIASAVRVHNQAPQPYSEKTYFDSLTAQQAQFEKQLGNITTDLATITARLEKITNTTQRITELEGAITKHKDLIFSSSETLIPAFNLSKCDCEALTDIQKNSLKRDVVAARDQINSFITILKSAPACARTNAILRDLNQQLVFLNGFQQIVDSNCKKAITLTPTVWQTNLNSGNWILGDQTMEHVVDEYFNRATKYENITNCDINTPYFNMTHCISCPIDAPLFNLYTAKCVSCPAGTNYDIVLKNCADVPTCQGQFFSPLLKRCVEWVSCPPSAPLDKTNNSCVGKTCKQGEQMNWSTGACEVIVNCNTTANFFDPKTKKCVPYVTCPPTKFLEKSNNTCVNFTTCDTDIMFLNKTINTCIYYRPCSGMFLNRTTNTCEKIVKCNTTISLYNKATNKCIRYANCSKDQWLNKTSNKCERYVTCVSNKILNPKTNTCEGPAQCPWYTFLNPTTNECLEYTHCNENQFLNKTDNSCVDFPRCPAGSYLNLTSNSCFKALKSCNASYFYNYTLDKCVPFENCSGSTYLDKNINYCMPYRNCAEEGKFLNKSNNTCVNFTNCNTTTELLNHTTNKCEKKPVCVGQFYDFTINQCAPYKVCENGTFLVEKLNLCVAYAKCPNGTYLDKNNNACLQYVNCSSHEFFNYTTLKCQAYKNCSDSFLVREQNTCVAWKNCTEGTYLITSSNTCAKYPNCTGGKVLNTSTGNCEWPAPCKYGEFYNTTTLKCQPLANCSTDEYMGQNFTCLKKPNCTGGKILNATTNHCEWPAPCKYGEFYNTTTLKCQALANCSSDEYMGHNFTCLKRPNCTGGKVLNTTTNHCEWPAPCKYGEFYNTTTLKCQTLANCPSDEYMGQNFTCLKKPVCTSTQFLDQQSNTCVPFKVCAPGEFLVKEINKCSVYPACPTGFTRDNVTGACLESLPTCNSSQFLNSTTRKCQNLTVPIGNVTPPTNVTNTTTPVNCTASNTFLDPTTKKCVPFVTCVSPKVLNKTTNECQGPVVCSDLEWKNNATNTCEPLEFCDQLEEIYVFQNNSCVPKPQCPEYYNYTTTKCEPWKKCTVVQVLNKDNNMCEPKVCQSDEVLVNDTGVCAKRPRIYTMYPKATNVYEEQLTLDQYANLINDVVNKNPNAVVLQCNESAPYSKVSSCIACPSSTPLFLVDNQTCVSCPQGRAYDNSSNKCRAIFYLNEASFTNIDLQGLSLDDYKSYEDSNIKSNPNAMPIRCNKTAPFSLSGQKCISCPAATPLFDITQNKCSACVAGTKYNQAQYTCV